MGGVPRIGRITKQGDREDGNHHTQQQGQLEMGVPPVNGVHAHHHQFGVADPDDINDPEHQVESEREQGQHSPKQDAADDRFKQKEVKNQFAVLVTIDGLVKSPLDAKYSQI